MKLWPYLAALPLAAQPLWMIPEEFFVAPGQRVRVTFRSAEGRAPGPEQLRSAGLYTPQAAYNVVNLRREGDVVLGEATVRVKGTLALGVCAAPDRRHCAKALLVSLKPGDSFVTRPLGLRFEIVPEEDPQQLGAGARLSVRVLLDGKPAAGIALSGGSRTGPDGRASVALGEPGPCRISAAQDGLTTTLAFTSGWGETPSGKE